MPRLDSLRVPADVKRFASHRAFARLLSAALFIGFAMSTQHALAKPASLSCSAEARDTAIVLRLTNRDAKPWSILLRGTPFEGMLADSVMVKRGHARMNYIGKMVKRGPPTLDEYAVIEPGQSREVSVVLDEHYEMTSTGRYSARWSGALFDARRGKIVKFDEAAMKPKTLRCPLVFIEKRES